MAVDFNLKFPSSFYGIRGNVDRLFNAPRLAERNLNGDIELYVHRVALNNLQPIVEGYESRFRDVL